LRFWILKFAGPAGWLGTLQKQAQGFELFASKRCSASTMLQLLYSK
jgi:hypothetical protein